MENLMIPEITIVRDDSKKKKVTLNETNREQSHRSSLDSLGTWSIVDLQMLGCKQEKSGIIQDIVKEDLSKRCQSAAPF